MRLWGLFRVPAKGLVVEPTGAISRRCRHCGWINVFDRVEVIVEPPITPLFRVEPSWRDVELKRAANGGG